MHSTKGHRLYLVGIVITTLLLFSPFFIISPASASAYPQIVWIDRRPITPIPDFPVDLTFNVIDGYSSITNCTLYYWLNDTTVIHSISPKIVDGDYKNATFSVQIPIQPIGTTVKYSLSIEDEIGYVHHSQNYSYTVLNDTTPQ